MTAAIIDMPDPSTYAARVAAKVRGVAAEQQVTNVVLARALKISENAMSRRMTGKLPFGVDELAAVATTLRVPITAFLPPVAGTAAQGGPDGGSSVAGAGFEPATSGTRAQVIDLAAVRASRRAA